MRKNCTQTRLKLCWGVSLRSDLPGRRSVSLLSLWRTFTARVPVAFRAGVQTDRLPSSVKVLSLKQNDTPGLLHWLSEGPLQLPESPTIILSRNSSVGCFLWLTRCLLYFPSTSWDSLHGGRVVGVFLVRLILRPCSETSICPSLCKAWGMQWWAWKLLTFNKLSNNQWQSKTMHQSATWTWVLLH